MKIDIEVKGRDVFFKTPEVVRDLRRYFVVDNPNPNSKYAKHIQLVPPSGRFDVGMWWEFKKFFDTKYDNYSAYLPAEIIKRLVPVIPVRSISNIDGFNYYYYQKEALEVMMKKGRGVISLPTASGKTLIIGGFCKTVLEYNPESKILVMVPNISLLSQTYSEFRDEFSLGDIITRWSGDKKIPDPDFNKSVVVSNTQFLLKDLDRSLDRLRHYDYVLIDEVHKVKRGNKVSDFVDHLLTDNKFGLTGTVPKEELDQWNIFGKVGPVIYSKKSYELRNEVKSISDVKVNIVRLDHTKKVPVYKRGKNEEFRPTGQYDNEIDFLYNSKWRNTFICGLTNKLNSNVLVLVDRIFHGKLLEAQLIASGKKKVYFIEGDTPDQERQRIFAEMETRSDIACVAMDTIFSTGISVKNLKYVVFVCIGKAYTKLLQSIGRSLRLHKDKKMAYIYDVSDYTKYSTKHMKKRIEFYKEEQINYEIKKIKENR